MADNTALSPAGPGGDTIRDLDRTGTGSPKTEVVQLDFGGPSPNPENLVSETNPLPVEAVEPILVDLGGGTDDDGIPYVNLSPNADIATQSMQLILLAAINGANLGPLVPGTSTVGTTSAVAVNQNLGRRGLVLTNTSTSGQTISLHLTGGTAVSLSGITLWPGDVFEMDRYTFTTNAIGAVASAASATLGIQEFQ